MAEIKIRKKRPAWPWIIGVLLVLGIGAYFYTVSDYEPAIEGMPPYVGPEGVGVHPPGGYADKVDDEPGTKADQRIAEYRAHIEDTSKLGTNADYTRSALLQLTEAVQGMARELDVQIDDIKTNAQLQEGKDASGTTLLAEEIKEVGGEIFTAIGTLQEEKFPELSDRTEKIKRTYGVLVPTTEISEQKEQIIAFFESCGDALKKMEPKN